MKKLIFFIMLLLSVLSFSSCECFDNTPQVSVKCVTYIQEDKGLLFVEVDSVKFAPQRIYSGESTRDGTVMMSPVKGMQVTCYTTNQDDEMHFIVGNKSAEYLEKYLHENYTLLVIFVCMCFFAFVVVPSALYMLDLRRKNKAR